MRLSGWWAKLPIELLTSLCILLPHVGAINFPNAPTPNLDISALGNVALAGNFDSISLYNYLGQDEDGLDSNGSQSILARFPDGGFAELGRADASIMDMCMFQNQVVVAGNFTSLSNKPVAGAALFDPNTKTVTPLPGLSGQVNTLLCQGDTVYFGGQFQGGNSTNAISWVTNWTNLPFAGFNGPVNSIKALPNGHIVYGGSFTGLSNGSVAKPKTPDAQTVNIGSANISSFPNTSRSGLDNPKNIICRTDSSSGSDWLLADNQPGFWDAAFGFAFTPTKLRLYNSQTPGYGTKTWRYTFYPTSGIANFSYFDDHGGKQYCDSQCPLANNNTYQDFYFVNPIEMYGIRIDISAWWGNGGGLGGMELFQDEIYSYAINDFNEPQCDDVSTGSKSTATPADSWTRFNPPDNSTNYLTSYLVTGTGQAGRPSVTFAPDLKQSGNYSIQVWTPGCIQDNSCSSRGQVNITGQVTSGSNGPDQNATKTIVQKNNYEKYDEVYHGYVDASSDSFRPSITLTPSLEQAGPLTVVASRVAFVLLNSSSTSNLNGLYEYDPTQVNPNMDNHTSAIDQAGVSLGDGANILALAVIGGTTYAAGNFSSPSLSNVLVVENGNASSLPGGGLDQPVQALYQDGDQPGATLYMGGNFSNTRDHTVTGLNNIASYSTKDRSWHAVGAGVNGMVYDILPLQINISSTEQQPAIAFSGYFDQILPFDTNPPVPVDNLAVWIPSRNNWVQNLGSSNMALIGHLSAQTGTGGNQVFGGNVDSQTLQVTGISGLQNSNSAFNLEQLPIKIQPQQTSPQSGMQKRASTQRPVQGVATGLFFGGPNGLNVTVMGGHFTTRASNGSDIENLALVYVSKNNQITGLAGNGSTDAAILALETQNTTLYAGGSIPNGLIAYDLVSGQPSSLQPPALNGPSAVVEAIAARPSSAEVYFGGSFAKAGALGCNGLCIYDTAEQRWGQPPQPIGENSIVNVLKWASPTLLYMAGNMTLQNNGSTLAAYDAKANAYRLLPGSNDPKNVPGPITAFSATDSFYQSFFAAGIASNGSAFITKFTSSSSSFPNPPDGTWTPVISSQQFNPATVIENIQMMSAQNSHSQTPLMDPNQILLITGLLDIQGFGNASAALFNGSTFEPFALSTMQDGTPGTLREAFVQNPGKLLPQRSSHHLALGFVVLIALAISLALIFLMVVAGILAERYRRRREGYVPAPTGIPSYEKRGNVGDISPERLFNGVGGNGSNGRGGPL